jgi:PadR family transcriptional regulator
MRQLTRADEILMVAIACLGDEAFSTRILEEVASRGAKKLTAGSLWVSLDHLAGKGYIRKARKRRQPPGGGRPRVYYRLSPKGVRMLVRMQRFQSRLWDGVPDLEKYGKRAR